MGDEVDAVQHAPGDPGPGARRDEPPHGPLDRVGLVDPNCIVQDVWRKLLPGSVDAADRLTLRYERSRHDGRAVFRVMKEGSPTALRTLDEEESSVAGGFRRVVVTTGDGVRAWAYEYGSGLDLTPIEDGDWLAHTARLR